MSRNSKEMQMKLQSTVDSLVIQAKLPKKQLSQTLRELVDYCKEHEENDPLLNPPRAEANPFREKSRCSVL